MFSRTATMPMSRPVSSAWMRTPSSKFRENRSRKATTMVSPGWTRDNRSSQPVRFMVRPLATSEKIKSSRIPWSARILSWVSRFLASSALLTRAYP